MINLRERVESDLRITLEKEWILPVILISPVGVIQTKSANDITQDLGGQVLYNTRVVNPETGEEMIVKMPNVSLRISSLDRVPLSGENWVVKIPITPSTTATKKDFVLSATRPPEDGSSIGFIRLYLQEADQS